MLPNSWPFKPEEEQSIIEFAKDIDVFVFLPTVHGKTLCYTMLPCVFDQLCKVEKKYMLLVISFLIALVQDQDNAITAMGMAVIASLTRR